MPGTTQPRKYLALVLTFILIFTFLAVPQPAVTAAVTEQLTVIVVDEDGQPIAGIYTQARLPAAETGARGQTDAQGRHTFTLQPGTYALVAWVTGYDSEEPTVTLTAGRPQEVTIRQTKVYGDLAGRVTDNAGRPLPGARVSVISKRTGALLAEGRTDQEGGYRFERLHGVVAQITGSLEGYLPTTRESLIWQDRTTTIDLALFPPASTETPGAVTGLIRASRNSAIVAGATVQLLAGTDVKYTGQTRADGTYRVEGVIPGPYTLRITREGFRPYEIAVSVKSGEAFTHDAFLLWSGGLGGAVTFSNGEPADVRVQLHTMPPGRYGPPLDSMKTTSAGGYHFTSLPPGEYLLAIFPPKGYPEIYRRVTVGASWVETAISIEAPGYIGGSFTLPSGAAAPGTLSFTDLDGRDYRSEQVGADGIYLSEPLIPGTYIVSYHSFNYGQTFYVIDVESEMISLLGVRIVQPLRADGVVMARGGAPLANAQIELLDPWGQYFYRTWSGQDGRFSVELQPDAYPIQIIAEGFEPLKGVLTVELGQANRPAYYLRPHGAPAVVLLDLADHWAEREILELVELGVVNGLGDGTFGPELTVTRAQFAKMIVVALGLPVEEQPLLTFADAAEIPAWAAGYVAAAAQAGLITGYADGTFQPEQQISPLQVAVILSRAMAIKGVHPAGRARVFADGQLIPGWAKADMDRASAAGLITGFADAIFAADQKATRAQAAVMILRLMKLK